MKIMRNYLIIAGTITFLYLALAFTNMPKYTNTKKIAPISKWSQILPGKWTFEMDIRRGKEIRFLYGEVEYFTDGTFTRKVTYEFYDIYDISRMDKINDPRKYHSGPERVSQGLVRGVWSISDSLSWIENYNFCNILSSFKADYVSDNRNTGCWIFYESESLSFGDKVSDTYPFTDMNSELIKFTEDEIIITETSRFNNTWSFKRIY